MYRDDQEALLQRAEIATREADKLREENQAIRGLVGHQQALQPGMTLSLPANYVYQLLDVRGLPMPERARLAQHTVTRFPVWATGLLNILTFGIFPLINFGLVHDRLPRAAHNDPSAGKAIGFTFIPYFNLYWIFFNSLRLADRLNLQLRLRGLPPSAPKGMLITAGIFSVIPYLNLIGMPIFWTIAGCMLQSTVNKVAALPPTSWDASEVGSLPEQQVPASAAQAFHGYPMVAASPEVLAHQKKARKLVGWSHVLGWGGIGVLAIGSAVAAMVAGPAVAGVVAVVGGVSAVTGAVVGQVGRGMQGRAI